MSVVIQNMGYVDNDDECHYALRINYKTLAGFTHRRSEGLATCLRKAADAIEQGEYECITDVPEHLRSTQERERFY